MFASVADAVNLDRGLVLEPSTFNTSFAIVLSASVAGTAFARQGLLESGVPVDALTNYSFPGEVLNLGYESADDTLTTVMRTAFYDNASEAAAYFDEVPFRLMRLRYKGNDTCLFGRAPLVNRSTGRTDATAAGVTLQQMKQTVAYVAVQAIETLTTGSDSWWLQVTNMVNGVPDNGFDCIKNATMCQGDCRDTLYPFSTKVYVRSELCAKVHCDRIADGLLKNDDVLVAVGVNHAATSMSSYSSLSVYDAAYFFGTDAVGNDQLLGTASAYVADTLPSFMQAALPYLYAVQIRRNCSGAANRSCLEVPQSSIPPNHAVLLAERAYNNNDTHVGPVETALVLPLIIHLRKTTLRTEKK